MAERTDFGQRAKRCERQGFELGARPVSNVVMARDFWLQALETQAVTSLRFVHCRPHQYSRFDAGRGDILETALAASRRVDSPLRPAEMVYAVFRTNRCSSMSGPVLLLDQFDVRDRPGPPSSSSCRRAPSKSGKRKHREAHLSGGRGHPVVLLACRSTRPKVVDVHRAIGVRRIFLLYGSSHELGISRIRPAVSRSDTVTAQYCVGTQRQFAAEAMAHRIMATPRRLGAFMFSLRRRPLCPIGLPQTVAGGWLLADKRRRFEVRDLSEGSPPTALKLEG